MPYYSCDTAGRLLRMLLINSYIGMLYNETTKAYNSGEYETAALISLEIAFMKGRVGTANFVFLGQRYLKDITIEEYYRELNMALTTEEIISDLRKRNIIKFDDLSSFLEYSYPNWKIVDPYKHILNPEDIIKTDRIFERTIVILENELISQFDMGVISLHKLIRLYNEGFETQEKIETFNITFDQTVKMLNITKTELISENTDFYKAEAHYLKARMLHVSENDLSKTNEKALQFCQNALSYKSPRKILYVIFYLYLKTEIVVDNLLNYIKGVENIAFYLISIIILVALRQAKRRIAKTLVYRVCNAL